MGGVGCTEVLGVKEMMSRDREIFLDSINGQCQSIGWLEPSALPVDGRAARLGSVYYWERRGLFS